MNRLTEEELNKYLTEAHPLNKQVPELVSAYRELVKENERLDKENERLELENVGKATPEAYNALSEENTQLKAETARYSKALEWYADQSNWSIIPNGGHHFDRTVYPRDWWQIDGHGWEPAQQALKDASDGTDA